MIEKECPMPEPFRVVFGKILFLTLLFFLTFVGRFIFAPLMPFISRDLGITPSQAGSIFLIGSVGYFLASVCSGYISSRLKHRGTFILAILTLGVTLLGCALVGTFWAIQATMLILGMAAGLNLPSIVATITALVSRQDWGKALAVQQMGPPSSLVLGPLLAVAFLSRFSWEVPLAFLGVCSIVVGIAFIRYGRFGDFPGEAPTPSLVKVVVAHKSFWIMVILFALAMGGQVGVYTMLPLYLVGERGMDGQSANTLVGVSQVTGLVMTFLAGWITDRIGEKRAIALFLFASGIATVFLGVLSGTWLKVIVFLQPALIVCYFPAGFAALSRIVQPSMRSLAAGWAAPTAFILGGGILPTLLGYIGQVHTFGLGIALAGVAIILGSALVPFLTLLEKLEEGC
jgi:NNP family nitrate/nitrite transporter-like MFS transporter